MKATRILTVLLIVILFGAIATGASQSKAEETTEAKFLKAQRVAEQGDAEAQYNLGVMYEYGIRGAPKDEVLAAQWYRKAAEQGNARAQHSLGSMYQHGRGGLQKDDAKAAEWYRKAAEQGNPGAQLTLDTMHDAGQRVDRRQYKHGTKGM